MLQFIETPDKIGIQQRVAAQAIDINGNGALIDNRGIMHKRHFEAPQPLQYEGEPGEWLDGPASKRQKV